MPEVKRRISVDIAISGQTQTGDLPLTLGRIDQVIITSDVVGQNVNMKIENEKGDIVFPVQNYDLPEGGIRRNLISLGVLTVTISDPTTPSGTVTVVAILDE